MGTYEDYLFANRALDVVNKHDPTVAPLLLYYAPHVAHAPLQVPDDYLHKFSFIKDNYRQRYHAMVNLIDDQIGNLTAALKAKGMWNNTLVR